MLVAAIGPWKCIKGVSWVLNRWQAFLNPISVAVFNMSDSMDKNMPTVRAILVWLWNTVSLALHWVDVILVFVIINVSPKPSQRRLRIRLGCSSALSERALVHELASGTHVTSAHRMACCGAPSSCMQYVRRYAAACLWLAETLPHRPPFPSTSSALPLLRLQNFSNEVVAVPHDNTNSSTGKNVTGAFGNATLATNGTSSSGGDVQIVHGGHRWVAGIMGALYYISHYLMGVIVYMEHDRPIDCPVYTFIDVLNFARRQVRGGGSPTAGARPWYLLCSVFASL